MAKPAKFTGAVESPIQSIAFVSLGCAKNLVDSERMLGLLAEDGLAITPDASEADAIVINTCGFLEASKEESLREIREAIEMKTNRQLQARGCSRFAWCNGTKTKLLKRRPPVSIGLSAVFDREHIVQAVRGELNPKQDHGHFLGKYHDLTKVTHISGTVAKTNEPFTTEPFAFAQGPETSFRRRPRPPSPHPPPLRLFANQRRVQPGLFVLHDPQHSRADAVQADRTNSVGGEKNWPPMVRSSLISSAKTPPASAPTSTTPKACPAC